MMAVCVFSVCVVGYSGDGVTCIACAIGKYKTSAVNSACNNCPTGKTTSSTGSTALSACNGSYNLTLLFNLK